MLSSNIANPADSFVDCYQILLDTYAEEDKIFREYFIEHETSNLDCVISQLKKNGFMNDALLQVIYGFAMFDDNIKKNADILDIIMEDKLVQSSYFCSKANQLLEKDESFELPDDDSDELLVDDDKTRRYCMRKYVFDNNLVEDPEFFVVNPDKLKVTKIDCDLYLDEVYVVMSLMFDNIFELLFTEQIVECVLDDETKKLIFGELLAYLVSNGFDLSFYMDDQDIFSAELQGRMTKKMVKCARDIFEGAFDLPKFF